MKTEVFEIGKKIIVKFHGRDDVSEATIRRYQRQLGCKLSWCACRDGKLILWNGPSNVSFAGWGKTPKRMRTELGFNRVDTIVGSVSLAERKMQSRYAKILSRRGFPPRVFQSLILPRLHGDSVSLFATPKLP